MSTVQVRFEWRSDTAANWASINPVPLAAEPCLESDTRRMKIGDGATAWNALAYWSPTTPVFALIEVNLGAVPLRGGRFTISGSGLTTGKPVQIFQAPGPYTGKGTRADEAEMDLVTVSASVTDAATITAYWSCARRIKGNIKFNYQIGA